MNESRSIEAEADASADYPAAREPRMDPPPAIGSDERRMHVRAYKFWVALLHGRPFPSVAGFDPAQIADFGDHGVLLDFTDTPEDAAIGYLGAALREESGFRGPITRVSDVPGRSLLSRLTDHYLQILANRAPIGFEAEFVNARGNNTLYRGILMPFSSDGATVDHVYGVINWKEMVDPRTAMILAREVGGAIAGAAAKPARPAAPAPLWADGPAAQLPAPDVVDDGTGRAPWPRAATDAPPANDHADDRHGLSDCLAAARGTVDQLRNAEVRTRSALYRAIGLAYDFACAAERNPDRYAELLAEAGIREQSRAPMTAVAKLVFGTGYDKGRLTEFASALAHGRRLGVASGGMRRLLEGSEGGLKAIVAAERAARRPATTAAAIDRRAALRLASPLATLELPPGDEEFVLLLARRQPDGAAAIVAHVPPEPALIDRAIRALGRR